MYIIEEVEVLYPKIDQPYHFDKAAGDKGRSVPCDAQDDGACYETLVLMDEKKAKKLHSDMQTFYKEKKEDHWDPLPRPKKHNGSDKFEFKATIKAAYGKRIVSPPRIFDAKNNPMPDGFQLGSGSIINLAVEFYAHQMKGGVALRPRAVQVLQLATPQVRSPFSDSEGFEFNANDTDEMEEVSDEIFVKEETTPEPKKAAKKKAATPPKEDKDINDIVDEWDD